MAVKTPATKGIQQAATPMLVDSPLSQMTDNISGRSLFPFNKMKKLVKILELDSLETYKFVDAWFEASLLDKNIEALNWLKDLSKNALKGESKYHLLDMSNHETIIEDFLKENMQALADEKTITLLSNPTCLKALSTILDLSSKQQKPLFDLLEAVRVKPEKLDLILGLLK